MHLNSNLTWRLEGINERNRLLPMANEFFSNQMTCLFTTLHSVSAEIIEELILVAVKEEVVSRS